MEAPDEQAFLNLMEHIKSFDTEALSQAS